MRDINQAEIFEPVMVVGAEKQVMYFVKGIIKKIYPNTIVCTVRGRKSQQISSFFNEVSASLQFPPYFGDNWSSFEDCLNEILYENKKDYIIIIHNACDLLKNDIQNLSIFFEVLLNLKEHRRSSDKEISNLYINVILLEEKGKLNELKFILSNNRIKYGFVEDVMLKFGESV